MKQLMILGGLVGFLIGTGFGLAQESAWPSVIWRSCIASFAAGMLLRWWGKIWVQGLEQAHRERMASSQTTGSKTSPTH
jgi:hypothetical protein